jgi:hypothetical protein
MTTSGRKTKSRLANPALCDSTEYNLLTFWQEIVTYASVNIFPGKGTGYPAPSPQSRT